MKWGMVMGAALLLWSTVPAQAQDPGPHVYWESVQKVFLEPTEGASIFQSVQGFYLRETATTDRVTITDSFQDSQGVVTVNQVSGNLNNMASLVSVNQPGKTNGALGDLPIYYTSIIKNNLIHNYGAIYKVSIGGSSFSNSRGVAAVTQVSGNFNNTLNLVGLAMNGAPGLAMSLDNASLSDVNASNNNITLGGCQAEVRIDTGAFRGFKGVGAVTMVAGNMNQILSTVSVKVNQ